MKDIIIVGAGHLGLDVYYTLRNINEVSPTWNIIGFINDIDIDIKSEYKIDTSIIGTIKDYHPTPNVSLAMAIGSCEGREKVATLLKSRGGIFETIISPLARVNETAIVGEGALILSSSKIGSCVELGDFTVIGDSTISYKSVIGAYTNTASYVNIYKNMNIGHHTQIWSGAIILADVGNHAVVGAGSVVVKKVKDKTKVFGNPAKKIEF